MLRRHKHVASKKGEGCPQHFFSQQTFFLRFSYRKLKFEGVAPPPHFLGSIFKNAHCNIKTDVLGTTSAPYDLEKLL